MDVPLLTWYGQLERRTLMVEKDWDWKEDHRRKNVDPLPCPNRIRLLRFERGWSSGDLAKRIQSARGTVLNYERGRLNPGWKVISRLCEVFEVEAGDSFWRKGEREHNEAKRNPRRSG